MGHYHIITIADDALQSTAPSEATAAMFESLGRAVVDLSTKPSIKVTARGRERSTHAAVMNYANAMHWVDDPHATDVRGYVWSGSCLQPLHAADRATLVELQTRIGRLLSSPGQPSSDAV